MSLNPIGQGNCAISRMYIHVLTYLDYFQFFPCNISVIEGKWRRLPECTKQDLNYADLAVKQLIIKKIFNYLNARTELLRQKEYWQTK